MRLSTLESLAKLFAIVANKDNNVAIERYSAVFNKFLESIVEDKYIGYLQSIFTDTLCNTSTGDNKKKLALNSVRVISLLEKSKNILDLNERLLVFSYLVILVDKTGINKVSEDFISEVSDSFDLLPDIRKRIFNFLAEYRKNEENVQLLDKNLIFVGNSVIIFKVFKLGFFYNGKILLPEEFCILTSDSVLTDLDGKNYFFPELKSMCTISQIRNKFWFVIDDLEYRKKSKVLVQKMSLEIESSQLIGIIGNSGSGKTSFLRCLSGENSKFDGRIGVVGSDVDLVRRVFVPQENSFVPGFSVAEHLIERCKFLQFGSNETIAKCAKVLEFSGITNIKNNRVCKIDFTADEISGGQQKRLAIATELLSEPDILIMDEPTSGLSSEDSYEIISRLKKLSIDGKLVIVSLHQPDFDIFMMFDKILIFNDGGFPVYFGSPANAADNIRQADGRADKQSVFAYSRKPSLLLNMLSRGNKSLENDIREADESLGEKLYNSFIKSNQANYSSEIKDFRRNNKLTAFKSFINNLRFGFLVDLKHSRRFVLMMLIPLITGIVFSFLTRFSSSETYTYFYNPNVPVWILIILTTAVFVGLAGSGHEFIYLRNYIKSRHRIADNSNSYVFAAIVRYLLISAFQTLLLVLPAVFIVENQFHFVSVFLFAYLMCVYGVGIGLLLSYLMKSTITVYLLIPLIIIPQLVYSGALIDFKNFNKIFKTESEIPIAASFVPMRWAAEGLLVDFYTSNPYYSKLYKNRCELYNAVYYSEIFIPAIQSLMQSDSINACTVLNIEQNRTGYITGYDNSQTGLVELLEHYNRLKTESRQTEDSIVATFSNPTDAKLKYTNESINAIINNSKTDGLFEVRNNAYIRKYKLTYILPEVGWQTSDFLTGYKSLGNTILRASDYNLVILTIFAMLNFMLLIIFVNLFKYYKNTLMF